MNDKYVDDIVEGVAQAEKYKNERERIAASIGPWIESVYSNVKSSMAFDDELGYDKGSDKITFYYNKKNKERGTQEVVVSCDGRSLSAIWQNKDGSRLDIATAPVGDEKEMKSFYKKLGRALKEITMED